MKNLILLLTVMMSFFAVAPAAEAGILLGLLGNRARNNRANVNAVLAINGVQPVGVLNRVQANRVIRQANNNFAFNARVANQALANQVLLQQLAIQQVQFSPFVNTVAVPQAVFTPVGFNGLGVTNLGVRTLNSPFAAVPFNSLALPATTFLAAPVQLRVNTLRVRGCRR